MCILCFFNRWTIKARVTNKPNMRTYSNSRGEGRIMSVELVDQSVSGRSILCIVHRSISEWAEHIVYCAWINQ